MDRFVRLVRLAVSTTALAVVGASSAWAQMPTVDPGGAAEPAPPPPAPASQEPVIIQVPVQGMPEGQVADESGFYYADDVNGRWSRDDDGDRPGSVHGPVPAYHVVRRGDTLWDLCWLYFNNPWEWPKVWSYNPSITNPHWIYPGDLVRLYPQGLSSPTPQTELQTALEDPEDAEDVSVLPTPARRHGVGLRQLAFVDQEELEEAYTVVGSVEEKSLLSTGDAVYLSYGDGKPPRIGTTHTVYTETTRVRHPSSGKVIGSYVKLLGQLQIQSVKQGKLARAVITESVDVIERGARAGPLQRTLRTVDPQRNEVDLQGTVVAMIGNDALIGQGQIIFIDKGKSDGVKPGNRLFVIRRGDAYDDATRATADRVGQDDQRFPARAIGEIMVVETSQNVSVAMVTLSLQEIGVGDHVLMRKARQ